MNIPRLVLPFCIGLSAWLGCDTACAQSGLVRSASGQFTARLLQKAAFQPLPAKQPEVPVAGGWAYLLSSSATPALGNNDEVHLQPSMLIVSCEHVKHLLLDKLGMPDQWKGRINLTINPALTEEQGPQMRAEAGPGRWTYGLQLPQTLRQEVLMRWLIYGMLLEIANRQAGVQSAEIPFWLVEGISANLQANNFPTFICQPGQNWTLDVRMDKRADRIPSELRHHAPLSFQQLSWPQASDLSAEGLPLFRGCAQFFLEELLRLNDGQACLRALIGELSAHWNWQTAFLRAYHSQFAQLLDVEKWWGVCYINTVNDYKGNWPEMDCQRTLQNTLDIPVAVHFGTNQLPVDAKITLQEVIREWPLPDASEALERTVAGLRFLEPRATPRWRPLVDLYLKTLLGYIGACHSATMERQLGAHPPLILPGAKSEAIKQLDELDRKRDSYWSATAETSPAS